MYSYIYNNYDESSIMYITIPVLFIANLPVIFFTLLDICEFKYFDSYRIKYNNERKYPTKKEICDGIIRSSKDFLGIIIPISFFGIYLSTSLDIYPYNMKPKLDIFTCIFHLFIILLMSDILFYFLHRIMHTSYLYKKFHKLHHKYKEPFALTNHYVDYYELLIFFIPPMIPPIILNSHIVVVWLSIILLNWNGILIHSGYNFKILCFKYKNYIFEFPCIKEHDYHHKYFNYNFGSTFPFMDQIMGTYYID